MVKVRAWDRRDGGLLVIGITTVCWGIFRTSHGRKRPRPVIHISPGWATLAHTLAPSHGQAHWLWAAVLGEILATKVLGQGPAGTRPLPHHPQQLAPIIWSDSISVSDTLEAAGQDHATPVSNWPATQIPGVGPWGHVSKDDRLGR